MWLSSIFRIAWLISRMLKGWRKPSFFQFKMIAISYKSLDKTEVSEFGPELTVIYSGNPE